MEGGGIGEAPRDDRVEAGETRLVNVCRGNVPASKSGFPLKALAPPQADRVGRESRRHALGLLVGMGLDIAPVRCDDHKAGMRAVILQSFDELVVGLGVGVVEGGMWHLGIQRTDECVARAEPLPASRAHANDIVRRFLADLANRVQSVLRVVALDPNLMSTFTPNRRELHGIGGAMLLVVDKVLLRGGQSLLNRCLVSSHQNPPCVALNTGTARLHPLSGANRKTCAHSEPYRF